MLDYGVYCILDRGICRTTLLLLIPMVTDANVAALLAQKNNEQSVVHTLSLGRLHPMATYERSCAFFKVVLAAG
ncbi:uncharacterized protein P174DRAFT_303757 [Aspergillus novofumigatus IBT 16806]|uniref:Uncharacterized protein n=1 Tax=Aspergillus novofumigatus (strain IBT 16806) TaxID=1392255 RepID=A0A2I1BS29_ASPN1|nr:uncharacterized protein P174DRAFT_196533 [Aspergillus novofumigatus IBT 16806]XP_024678269.1 uncharacterized protein P174DRAFT_303757 [Aspergillus novofumigatus IBT 16806]PKX88188.1 hypothetical protein P174DRAFT_196533 [Aspergillus novofumigatus IBT 16806]PKX89674.1 hypothetical protein P174DRAFT_303757 [Aspergillus novofumigatus IBT 16806]